MTTLARFRLAWRIWGVATPFIFLEVFVLDLLPLPPLVIHFTAAVLHVLNPLLLVTGFVIWMRAVEKCCEQGYLRTFDEQKAP